MCETSGYQARRPGWLGVHSLNHIGLIVPDLAEAKNFYDHFGLDVRPVGSGLEARVFGHDHVWLRLVAGPAKRLDYISFGVFADDLERFSDRLNKANIDLLKNRPLHSNNIWFRDPLGITVELQVAPKVMPDDKVMHNISSCPPGMRAAVMRGETSIIHPTRLAHALFFTPDIKESVKFYCDILGLRVSDFPGPVAFLHGAHGSDHHLIAFAESDIGVGYHHTAWDVESIEEVGLGAAQMAAAGYKRGWGLGRHVLGSNYFNYIRDPWGSYAEYSYDIDYVPVVQDWPAAYPKPENSLYLWGPDVPDDFVNNYETPEKF